MNSDDGQISHHYICMYIYIYLLLKMILRAKCDAAFLLTVAYNGAFLLTIDNFSFFTHNLSFFCLQL